MSSRHGAARVDGRLLRAERSHQAIVEALLELVGSGTPVPTAQQVADQAGVGIRTVFRHFSDMEKLFAEMSERMREELEPLLQGGPPGGSLKDRLQDLIRRRVQLYERIMPYWRSTEIQRWRSPFLEDQVRGDGRALRAELRRWLPELDQSSPDRLEALDAVLSIEFWRRLRSEQRLGFKRALASLEQTALGIVRGLGR